MPISIDMPRCPFCNSKRVIRCGEWYHCRRCEKLFDDAPDEGGDYSNRPSARMEKLEAHEQRQKQRQQQRQHKRRKR